MIKSDKEIPERRKTILVVDDDEALRLLYE
jgi:hypothetical protein